MTEFERYLATKVDTLTDVARKQRRLNTLALMLSCIGLACCIKRIKDTDKKVMELRKFVKGE